MLRSRHWACVLLPLIPLVAAFGQPDGEVGNHVCRSCHAAIYRAYSRTSMALSSGTVGTGEFRENLDRAGLTDAALGAQYRIVAAAEGYRLEFAHVESGVSGERLLRWFVGSGRVARSYVASLDGFLYQAPVSYYSNTGKWDLSPGYGQHRSIHLTRAIGTGCLQCHASRLQAVSGTQNRFADPPFLDPGIGCERCHGPGGSHATRMRTGKGPDRIVHPGKLDPGRRDSVCAQCHLTGVARIARLRRGGDSYQPGRLLADYFATFVWSGAEAVAMGANSHFEKLQQSGCKRASGDGLWCGSCHDAHSEPEAEARAGFYRARCLKCHVPAACKENAAARARSQNDCTACHMPKAQVRDTEHAVFTDHTIPRGPGRPAAPPAGGRSLSLFAKGAAGERDLALAYAAVAGEDSGSRRRAFDMLRILEAKSSDDVQLLAQLAQLYDQSGDEDSALALSERIVRLDPAQIPVAVNLGTYYIQRGRQREAMRLWVDALKRSPGLTSVSMNLAVAQFQSGDPAAAEATLVKALHYDPDHATARKMLAEIRVQ